MIRFGTIAVWLSLGGTVWSAPGDALPSGAANVPPTTSDLDQAAGFIQTAQSATDADRRAALLADARKLLDKFQSTQPAFDESGRAEMWLGALLMTEGKAAAEAAAGLTDAAAKAAQLESARATLREADQHLAVAVDRLQTTVRSHRSFIEANAAEIQKRDAWRGTFIQSQVMHALVVEELAATYPAEGAEARELFQAAADRHERIYRDYRTLLVGLSSRLKQGQCYRNLGDTKRALGLYNDILSQPPELEPLRQMRVTAMYLSLECWNMPQESLHELAFSQGEEYLTGVRPEESQWPEWQAVRYHTARGYLLAAEKLPADRAAERAEWLGHAREKATTAAETDGPYREAARALLGEVRRAAGELSP